MRSRVRFGAMCLIMAVWTVAEAGDAWANQIVVTPRVEDLSSLTAQVDGRRLLNGSSGDQFTLGYYVENPDAASILFLFSSITYDPNVLRFIGGNAAPIFEQFIPEFTFDRIVNLNPISAPRPRPTSPSDTLIGLSHVSPPQGTELFSTNATGPDFALDVTFEIIDPAMATSIEMAFLAGDAAMVNGESHCGLGSATSDCDFYGDGLWDFRNFKVNPGGSSAVLIPEPSIGLLIGLGLVVLNRTTRPAGLRQN